MDPNSGKIYQIESDEERKGIEKRLGHKLISVPRGQLAKLEASPINKRIAWARRVMAAKRRRAKNAAVRKARRIQRSRT